MTHPTLSDNKQSQQRESGQGLTEYALVLVLVSLGAVAIMSLLGPSIRDLFAEVQANLAGATPDQLMITQADYNPNSNMLRLRATVNGGIDEDISLTASPGGAMQRGDDFYHLNVPGADCPCTITITSSGGGSVTASVP
jgi:Flp pilus assembly pilin Flp